FGVFAQRTDEHPKPGADEFAFGDQFLGNFLREVDRDGEADAAVHTADERVDADHFAINVHQRAAAVSRIDARVGLEEILVNHDAPVKNGPPLRADMAERHAVIQLERRADGDGEFAHPRLRGIAEFRNRQGLAADGRINLDDGDVGLWVHPANLRVVFFAVLETDFDLVRAFHDVAVGEDKTVFANHDAGALPVEDRLALRALASAFFEVFLITPPQLGQKVEEGVAVLVAVGVFGFVRDADDDHGGRNLLRDFDERLVKLSRQVDGGGFFPRGRRELGEGETGNDGEQVE